MVEKVIKIVAETKQAAKDISDLFNDMVEKERKAQNETKKLNEEIDNVGKSAKKSNETQVTSLKNTSKAVQTLDKYTGGLASSFVDVAKAAKKGGAAMKSALISTGIGAFLVILGEVIDNWEDISNWITGANEELERQKRLNDDINRQIERQNGLRELGVDLIKMQADEDILRAKIAGKSEEEIYKIREKAAQDILALQQQQVDEANRILQESVNADEETYQKAIDAQEQAYKELSKARVNLNKVRLEEELRLVDDGNKKKSDKEEKAEERRLQKIDDIRRRFAEQKLDIEAKTEEEKLARERQRAQDQLDQLVGTETEKREAQLALNALYDEKELQLKRDKAAKEDAIDAEIFELRRTAANERALILAQDAIDDVDEEKDPFAKLEKEKEFLELQNQQLEEDYAAKQELYAGDKVKLAQLDEDYKTQKLQINNALDKNAEETAEKEKQYRQAVKQQSISLADQTLGAIAGLAKEGSDLAKGVAVAQATMDTYKSAVAAYAAGSSVGGPAGLILGPVSAAIAVAAGLANIKKILSTKPIERGQPSAAGSGGGASVPQAPSFNLVEGSGTNQIAEGIAGQQNQPLQAYVVSGDVTTAQSLDRNIVDESSF